MTPADDVQFAAELYFAIGCLHRRILSKAPMTPSDARLVIHQVREAAKASADGTIDLTISAAHAVLFVEFLHDFDPDMPPRPICKVLGPLVGDFMMNDKLNRLDDIADKLGPMVLLLTGSIAGRTLP